MGHYPTQKRRSFRSIPDSDGQAEVRAEVLEERILPATAVVISPGVQDDSIHLELGYWDSGEQFNVLDGRGYAALPYGNAGNLEGTSEGFLTATRFSAKAGVSYYYFDDLYASGYAYARTAAPRIVEITAGPGESVNDSVLLQLVTRREVSAHYRGMAELFPAISTSHSIQWQIKGPDGALIAESHVADAFPPAEFDRHTRLGDSWETFEFWNDFDVDRIRVPIGSQISFMFGVDAELNWQPEYIPFGNNLFAYDIESSIDWGFTLLTVSQDWSVDEARWVNPASGGGFEFTTAYMPGAEAGAEGTLVRAYWAAGPTRDDIISTAYEDVLIPSAQFEQSKWQIAAAQMPSGFRSPPPGATHLLVIADADDIVAESNENNNLFALPIRPSVVAVTTHGWNSSGAAWNVNGATLEQLPERDSLLDGRVTSYVPNWDSNSGFTSAFLSLATSKLYDIKAEQTANSLEAALYRSAAASFRTFAQQFAMTSRALARGAAEQIVVQLIHDGRYLLDDPQKSLREQEIVLVGHSRGAAVNAEVSGLLWDKGYTNIAEYVSLDGFSTDWPADGGLIGDVDIPLRALADERTNYRVQLGLAAGALDWLVGMLTDFTGLPNVTINDIPIARDTLNEAFGDLRAPERVGFANEIIVSPAAGVASHHMNVTSMFFDGRNPYLGSSYIGSFNSGAGASAAGAALNASDRMTSTLSNPLVLRTLDSTGDVPVGFRDGSFDELQSLLAGVPTLGTTGDLLLDSLRDLLNDPVAALRATWSVNGNVVPVLSGNPAVRLTQSAAAQSSLSQVVKLPSRPTSLNFNMTPQAAGTGDVLEVLMDGQVIQTIDLTTAVAGARSVSIAGRNNGGTSEFTFRLAGPSATPARVLLDDFQIGAQSNSAPQLADRDFSFTTPKDLPLVGNSGWLVSDLLAGMTDSNSTDRRGIALIGTDSTAGRVQYSLDGGRTWTDAGTVSEAAGLLLPADENSRLRFIVNPNWAGETGQAAGTGLIGDVIRFRAWDRTVGLAAVPGERWDTQTNGGSTPFSTATDSVSLTVVDDPLVVNLGGGTNIALRRSGNNLEVVNRDTFAVIDSQPLSETSRIVLRGNAGAAETFVIDFGAGGQFYRPIQVLGSATGTGTALDQLIVRGGDFGEVVLTSSGPGAGTLKYDGVALKFAGIGSILDVSAAGTFTLEGTAAADTLAIADGPRFNLQQTLQLGAHGGRPSVALANKGQLLVHGLGGADSLTLNLTARPTGIQEITLHGDGRSTSLDGAAADVLAATALRGLTLHLDGGAGNDQATVTGTSADEIATLRPGQFDFVGTGLRVDGRRLETVTVKAGTGNDAAHLYDSSGNDLLVARPAKSTLSGPGYSNTASNFDRVDAYGRAGGSDRAQLYDSPGADVFRGRSTVSFLAGPNFVNYARGFERVDAYATAGGDNRAFLYDTAGNETFNAAPDVSSLAGSGFVNYARGFARVDAYAGNGTDVAVFTDSAGDDIVRVIPGTSAYMKGAGFLNYARSRWNRVQVSSTNGGNDRALLYDTSADDTFTLRERSGSMTGGGYDVTVNGFPRIEALSRSGNDLARFFDSAGDDRFKAYPDVAFLTADTFTNYARGFRRVTGQATLGGNDKAYLYDSAGNDRFTSREDRGILSGSGFTNTAIGFGQVFAYAGTGTDTAVFEDARTGDVLFGRTNTARLTRRLRRDSSEGFDRVEAHAATGATPTLDVSSIDYVFESFGGWN